MSRRRLPSRLHLLSVRDVQTATDGGASDGGGLLLALGMGLMREPAVLPSMSVKSVTAPVALELARIIEAT